MPKRVGMVLVIAFALAFGLIGWQACRLGEPTFEGKRASAWALELNQRDGYAPAANAIRQMGTNALPTLLAMLAAEDSPSKQRLVAMAQKFPMFRGIFPSPSQRHLGGLFGLEALGSAARPATPELLRLLSVTNAQIRCFSAQVLGSIGGDVPRIVPALTNLLLQDLDCRVRQAAAENLGRLGQEPGQTIPALIAQLGCTNAAEFQQVSLALQRFGAQARPAAAALEARLEDSDRTIRQAAADTLKWIETESGRMNLGDRGSP